MSNKWLQVMGGEQELASAVQWLQANLKLDLDVRIHVFELTIRALGEALQLLGDQWSFLLSALSFAIHTPNG